MYFFIQTYCPVTKDLETGEGMDELDEIRLRNEGVLLDGYEKEESGINLYKEIITQLNARCFVPKSGTNKRWATEIVFDSGRVIYACDKPIKVAEQIVSYLDSNPIAKEIQTYFLEQ